MKNRSTLSAVVVGLVASEHRSCDVSLRRRSRRTDADCYHRTVADLWIPPSARPSLAHIQTYVAWSEFTKGGRAASQRELVNIFGQFNWADTLRVVARVAALWYATDTASAATLRDATWGVVDRLKPGFELWHDGDLRDVILGAARADHARPMFHEGLGHLMAACAILFGADEGEPLSDLGFISLALALNDYARRWRDEFGPNANQRLQPDEVNLANMVQGSQYDHRSIHDARAVWVRARYMFELTPRNWMLLAHRDWIEFLDAACDGSFASFFCRTLGVLHISATQWGRADANGSLREPTIRLLESGTTTREFDALVRSNSIGREEARELLSTEIPTGSLLPISPTLFFRKPFVQLSEDTLCAPVPRVVLDQCATGLWNRFREHASTRGPSAGSGRRSELWTRAFGDIVELWCHRVADRADVQEEVILTPIGANEQIEDVVLRSSEGVILFSVKARLLVEKRVKGASSRHECVHELDEFLFAHTKIGKGRSRRQGVLRQLDTAVDRARRDLKLDAAIPVIPVLVTYDQYGLDNEPCYRWVQRRCSELGLFTSSMPVTFMTINDFERLFAYGEQGESIVTFLLERYSQEGGRYPVHIALAGRPAPHFTKAADNDFEAVYAEVMKHVEEIQARSGVTAARS